MPTKLLTIEEVAERLHISVPTLRFWRHRGDGPQGFKVGKVLRYREADVEAWIADQMAADMAKRSA